MLLKNNLKYASFVIDQISNKKNTTKEMKKVMQLLKGNEIFFKLIDLKLI